MPCENCLTCGGDTRLVNDSHKAVIAGGELVQVKLHHLKETVRALSEEHLNRPGGVAESELINELLGLLQVKPAKRPALSVAECRARLKE